jgi:hypothetical protein
MKFEFETGEQIKFEVKLKKPRVVKEKARRKSPFGNYFFYDSLVCYKFKLLIIIYLQFENATIYTVNVFFNFTSNFICSPVSNSNFIV